MCGRYAIFLPPEAIRALFRTSNPLPNTAPTWNKAPMQSAPVIRHNPATGERHLDLLRWGLIPWLTADPKGGRRPINARAETVAYSGMFRAVLAKRRCLVPADAFYEWQARPDGKQPYAIARTDGGMLAFAGLWDSWRAPDGEVVRTYAIITTTANATMRELHDRMPVIIEEANWPAWLGEANIDAKALLRPADEGAVRLWPVSRAVNLVANNGPELLAPLPALEAPATDIGVGRNPA